MSESPQVLQPVPPPPVYVPTRRATDLPPDAPWWAHWLAANWSSIHREFSMWFVAAIGFLAAAAETVPMWSPELAKYVSGPTLHYMIGACALAALVSKFIRQDPKPKEPQP